MAIDFNGRVENYRLTTEVVHLDLLDRMGSILGHMGVSITIIALR